MYFFLKYLVTLFYKKLRIKIVVSFLCESGPWRTVSVSGLDIIIIISSIKRLWTHHFIFLHFSEYGFRVNNSAHWNKVVNMNLTLYNYVLTNVWSSSYAIRILSRWPILIISISFTSSYCIKLNMPMFINRCNNRRLTRWLVDPHLVEVLTRTMVMSLPADFKTVTAKLCSVANKLCPFTFININNN